MPEQTVKHDNTASGFLLVLIPVAFFAVFVSVAWPFIVGATLLFTGNSVWQSYQLAKLSQQVNPLFNRLIIEKQGQITPVELSVRANISSKAANRYLYSKAVEFGGTSQQVASQGLVYNFLTVNSLDTVFAGINPNPTALQKLAEFDAPAAPVESLPLVAALPVIEKPAVSKSLPTMEPELELEVAMAPPPIAEPAPVEEMPSDRAASTPVIDAVPETVLEPIEATVPEATVELITEPVAPTTTVQPVVAPAATPLEDNVIPVSAFGQALRSVFNAENAEFEELTTVAASTTEPASSTESETISQADLAKRLDVHASTIYKRRADVSFPEWTRNRDPEGLSWGYSRESKEFYRLA
jgi:hypothetical protein